MNDSKSEKRVRHILPYNFASSNYRKPYIRPGERYHFRQQSYGAFNLTYSLPTDVKPDEVKAIYKNGVLEITMPKAEVREARKVQIEEQS